MGTSQRGRIAAVSRVFPTDIDRWRIWRRVVAYSHAGSEAVLETLWPTRCAVCDRPGDVLCMRCRRNLPYIDRWWACPVCGAPYGRFECTECNPISLRETERTALPFDECISALLYDERVARIVRTHKDAGERRLGQFIAFAIACAIPPEWVDEGDVVSYIPATSAAKSRRGFDHGRIVASSAADMLGLRCDDFLLRPHSRDQRRLSRNERFANMQGRFRAVSKPLPPNILLLDDVYTTGATLCAASDALRMAGVARIRCATFARVY